MVGSTAPLAGMVKEFGVFDLPFLFNSEKEADAVLDGWARTCSRSWRPRGWWAWSIGRTAFAT